MRPPFQAPQPKLNKVLVARLTQLLTKAMEAQNQGDNHKAKELYQQVVKIQPANFECWHILGVFEYQIKNYDEALKIFTKVISIQPRFAPAHSNLGLVLQDLKRYKEAIASYDKSLELDASLYAAYNNRGNAFKDLGIFDKALESYSMALIYLPDYAEAIYNLAEIYKCLHRFDDSLKYYDRAIHTRPNYAEAHNNRGLMLQFLNRVDEAIQSFDRTLQIWPDYAPAHSNKSLALLLQGNYSEGFEEHEWRWRMKEFTSAQRHFHQPQWDGSIAQLEGKTILIHCEQGLGDTLQFCRYVPFVLETGARVLFEVQASVYGLMKQIINPECLIKQGDQIPDFDLHCPLISIVHCLRSSVARIPSRQSYLTAEEATRNKWSSVLGQRVKPRIGYVWSGNVHHHNDFFRSIPLQTFLPYLISLSQDFDCICLQKEFRTGELELLAQVPGWRDFSVGIVDFEDTAALCELVDLVITVDTSVAHLAAALGRPTWVMLPFAPDWRWLLERDDSPWYPSVKLYRQKSISNWNSVLDPLTLDIKSRFGVSTVWLVS